MNKEIIADLLHRAVGGKIVSAAVDEKGACFDLVVHYERGFVFPQNFTSIRKIDFNASEVHGKITFLQLGLFAHGREAIDFLIDSSTLVKKTKQKTTTHDNT